METVANILARLAVSRARLQHAMTTAADCGNSKWCHRERPHLDSLDRRIESLKKVVRPEILTEARELTNADI